MPAMFKTVCKHHVIDHGIQALGYAVIAIITLLPIMLFFHSIPLLEVNSLSELLFSNWDPENAVYGLRVFIFTTLIMGVCATFAAFMIGLSLSLYIYCHKTSFIGRSIQRLIVAMSGVPTVVYGFIGAILLVPFIREHTSSPTGYSLLATIIMLAILITPTIVFYINQSFNSLPQGVKSASLSLGASDYQFYFYVLIPHSLKGITVALILGFARAISDTMLALMISGNAFSSPSSLTESSRSLTAHIALTLPGEFDGIEFKAIFFTALLLFVFISVFNVAIHLLNKERS